VLPVNTMILTLPIHRGPVVVEGWQRPAANEPAVDVHTNPASSEHIDGDVSRVAEFGIEEKKG